MSDAELMDVSGSEIDAKLIEQFSSLGTDDREDLIKSFKSIIGDNISLECCKFFLEAANWNLQRGIGAYFDYSFELPSNTTHNTSSTTNFLQPRYNARIFQPPDAKPISFPTLFCCLHNCGSETLLPGSYITAENDPTIATLASVTTDPSSFLWTTLPEDARIPLPSIPPGNITSISIHMQPLPVEVMRYALSVKVSVIGALRLCLPSGDRFGDVLYCEAVPHPLAEYVLYQIKSEETSTIEGSQRMDDI